MAFDDLLNKEVSWVRACLANKMGQAKVVQLQLNFQIDF